MNKRQAKKYRKKFLFKSYKKLKEASKKYVYVLAEVHDPKSGKRCIRGVRELNMDSVENNNKRYYDETALHNILYTGYPQLKMFSAPHFVGELTHPQ